MSTAAMWGADTAALEHLGTNMGQSAQVLRNIQGTIRAKLRSVPWDGPGADRFRAEWDGKYGKALLAAAGLVEEAARTLRAEAAQQDDASMVGPGRGPGLTLAPVRGAADPVGVDGAKESLTTLGGINLAQQLVVGVISKALAVKGYAAFLTAVAKNKPMPDIYRAWASVRGYTGTLAPWLVNVGKGLKISTGALATAGKLASAWTTWGGPALTVVSGVTDVITGGGYDGARGNVTRVAGGIGAIGGAALLASSAGLIALGPIGGAIAVGAVVGYGLYSLGNLIYDNREAIGHAFSTAGNWVAHQAGAAAGAVASKAAEVVDGVKSTITRAITNPISLLPKISVF